MNRRVYILDTNVLYNFIETLSGKELEFWNRTAKRFLEKYGNQSLIPSLVLAEFCGVWFHKNVDFENYDFWFQKRLALFNQMYLQLKRLGVKNCNEDNLRYQDIMKLSQDITNRKMPKKIINQIVRRIERTIARNSTKADVVARNKRNLTSGKLLDGLDSVVVSFAYGYAKKSKVGEVVVVSSDRFMIEIVNGFKSDRVLLNSFNLPYNVSGILPS